MIFLWGIPILFLIMPAVAKQMLIYLALYLFLCGVLYNQYGNDYKYKIEVRNQSLRFASLVIDVIMVFLFYQRWKVFGLISIVASYIHLSGQILTFIIGVVLGIVAYKSICIFVSLLINYFSDFSNTKLYKVCNKEDITFKGKVLLSGIMSVGFYVSQKNLPIYTDIDNYSISCILNQLYDKDNYCLFVNPILGGIVKFINTVLVNADGFVFLMELLMFIGVWNLLYVLFGYNFRKINIALTWLVLICFNYSLNIFHANFTVYTGALSLLAFIGLYAFIHKKTSYLSGVISLLLFVSASLWRFSAQLLFVPFIALVIFAEVLCYKKEVFLYIKRFVFVISMVIICCFAARAMTKITNNSDVYKQSVQYNSARSKIFDYVLEDWEVVGAELEQKGISKNDFESVKTSILADTDIITTDYLNEVYNISRLKSQNSMSVLGQKMSDVWYVVNNDFILYIQIVLFVLILIALMLFGFCNKIRILELLLSYAGTLVIIAYFAYIGRIPDRVIQTIFLCNWCVVISSLFDVKWNFSFKTKTMQKVFLGMLIGMNCVLGCNTEELNNSGSGLNAKVSQENIAIDNISYEDSLLVWGVSDYNDYVEKIFWQDNKLPSSDFMSHNITDGKWVYGQVYYNNYLESIGVKNPMKALLEDDVYYVANEERCEMIEIFLQEHYDKTIDVKRISTVDDIPVWKFYKEVKDK